MKTRDWGIVGGIILMVASLILWFVSHDAAIYMEVIAIGTIIISVK